jgi:hypothetical protein
MLKRYTPFNRNLRQLTPRSHGLVLEPGLEVVLIVRKVAEEGVHSLGELKRMALTLIKRAIFWQKMQKG